MFEKPELTYRELRHELERLADEIATLKGGKAATERWQRMRGQAEAKWSEARDSVQERAHEADEYVHRNPWRVVSGALLVGLLIGLFSGKCRRGH